MNHQFPDLNGPNFIERIYVNHAWCSQRMYKQQRAETTKYTRGNEEIRNRTAIKTGEVNGRPQAWARGDLPLPASLEMLQCFCALVVTVKRSIDQLFMHYFDNFPQASAPLELELHPSTPLGDFRPQIP